MVQCQRLLADGDPLTQVVLMAQGRVDQAQGADRAGVVSPLPFLRLGLPQ